MNYLFLSAHTDDAEFGAGATISRLVEEGNTVNIIAFSYCGKKELKNEMLLSCKQLGINGKIIILNNYVRFFHENRQDILNTMLSLKKNIDIDTVFTFSKYDIHQDHKVIYEESLRAFKDCSIYGYNFPHNNFEFSSDSFFKIEKRHLDNKIMALKAYKSQQYRPYMDEAFILANARYSGIQAGSKYAECFELIRQII